MYSIQSLEANIVTHRHLKGRHVASERKGGGKALKPVLAQGREIPKRPVEVVHWALQKQAQGPGQASPDRQETEHAEPSASAVPLGRGNQAEAEDSYPTKITEPAYGNQVPVDHMQLEGVDQDGEARDYREVLQSCGPSTSAREAKASGGVNAGGKGGTRHAVVLRQAANSRAVPMANSKSQVQTERLSCIASPPETGRAAARQKSASRNLPQGQQSRSSQESAGKRQSAQLLMNRDIQQLLGRGRPSEESLEAINGSQRGLHSRLDKDLSPQKRRLLDS